MVIYKKRSLEEIRKMLAEEEKGVTTIDEGKATEPDEATIKKIKKAVEKEIPDKTSAIFKAAKEATKAAEEHEKPRKTEVKKDEIITLEKVKPKKASAVSKGALHSLSYSFKKGKYVEDAVLDVVRKYAPARIPTIVNAIIEHSKDAPVGTYKKGVPKATKIIQWTIWKAWKEGKLKRVGFGTYKIGDGTPPASTSRRRSAGSVSEAVKKALKERTITPKIVVKPVVKVEMPSVASEAKEAKEVSVSEESALKPETVAKAEKGEFEASGSEAAEEAILFKTKAPDKYYSEKELVNTYEAMYSHPDYPPLMLVGPPGVGKTTSVEDFAVKKKVPYITIQANRDTTDLELIGHDVLKSDGHGGTITEFEPGELPRAVKAANKYGAAILLVDEINALQPEYQLAFNSLLDGRRAVFGAKRKWELEPGANLILIGTMNPEGYEGTNPINNVLRSRFTFMDVDYPKPRVEAKIMAEYTSDSKLIEKLMTLADFSRKTTAGNPNFRYPLSPRDLKYTLKVYNAHLDVGESKEQALKTALSQCIIKKYIDPTEQKAVSDYIHSLFGRELMLLQRRKEKQKKPQKPQKRNERYVYGIHGI